MFDKILLVILILGSSLAAKESFSSERLIGIEVGYGTLDTTNNLGKINSKKDVEYGFRIGAQNNEWRTTLSANFNMVDKEKFQRVMLSFDHFVWTSLYKTDNIIFKPYLGGHVGWMRFTDDIEERDTGMVYGGQAGVAWNVLKEVDFDVSYRYSITDLSKIDKLSSFVFGVNYIY